MFHENGLNGWILYHKPNFSLQEIVFCDKLLFNILRTILHVNTSLVIRIHKNNPCENHIVCHTLNFVYLHFDYHHSFKIGGSTITCIPNIGYLQLQRFGPNLYDLYLVPTCVGSSSFKTNAHWIEGKVIIPSKDIQFTQTMSRNHHEGGHESFNPWSQNGISEGFVAIDK